VDIVGAAWGLVVVTAILVLATFVGIWKAERHATEQRSAAAEQTAALARAATATQAMADEMLEARRAANQLELEVELADDAGGSVFNGRLVRDGPAGIVLERAEILMGPDRLQGAEPLEYANFYLGGSANETSVNLPFERQGRDLLTLRVTGTPGNGLRQNGRVHLPDFRRSSGAPLGAAARRDGRHDRRRRPDR
jgi:hypothetical protein